MALLIDSKFKSMRPPAADAQSADQKLKDVSKMYEKHFLNEMMKAMRSTVQESGFIKVNQGEKIFREQLDQEYVDAWSKKGGIGLSDLIYNQLVEKYGAQLGLTQAISKPSGPIAMKEDSKSQVKKVAEGKESVSFAIRPMGLSSNDKADAPFQLQAPWAGRLVQNIKLGPDEYFLRMQHENGLQSDLRWNGIVSRLNVGDEVQAGQGLGYLSPDQHSVLWGISQKNVSE